MYTYIAGKEPYFTFEISEENRAAMKAVEAFSENQEQQLLCIYGKTGTGKSHLAYIARDLLHEEGLRARIFNELDVIEKAISWASEGKSWDDFYENYKSWDAIILEDIQYYNDKPSVQEVVLNLINALWIRGKKILVTCDTNPEDIEWFEDAKAFPKVELSKPSKELKYNILKAYEAIAEIELSEEVRKMIVEYAELIPTMKQIFNQAIVYHEFQEEELDEKLFGRIIQNLKKVENE